MCAISYNKSDQAPSLLSCVLFTSGGSSLHLLSLSFLSGSAQNIQVSVLHFYILTWWVDNIKLLEPTFPRLHRPCFWYSWTGTQVTVVVRTVSGLATSEIRFGLLQMTWFCWLLQSVTAWFAAKFEVVGTNVNTFQSKVMACCCRERHLEYPA